LGLKMQCQKVADKTYLKKKFFTFFIYYNHMYVEPFLKQSLMTTVYDFEI
jgi:hypothetical protein